MLSSAPPTGPPTTIERFIGSAINLNESKAPKIKNKNFFIELFIVVVVKIQDDLVVKVFNNNIYLCKFEI